MRRGIGVNRYRVFVFFDEKSNTAKHSVSGMTAAEIDV
jgi:hypothetical protein